MSLLRRRFAILCLLLLVAVSYAGVLGNAFTNWDDEHLIVNNGAIRSFAPLFVLGNFHLTYPPVTIISHCADYYFWRLNPVGYHITDLLLYFCVVAAFFFLCENITGNRAAAFVAAALFSVHPLHVESVTWLSSRKDGLSLFFYLLAFLAYCRSRGRTRRAVLWLSVLFYFLALWSKPLMITLPLALVLYDLLCTRPRPGILSSLAGKLPYALPLAVTAAAAVFLDPHNEIRIAYHGGSACRTFLMMTEVCADYLRMLALPVDLSPFYVTRVPAVFSEPGVVLSAALLLALFIGALTQIRKRPLVSFCVFWGAVSLLPVMQIVPINVVKADRYLYLPSAAFCFFLGAVIFPTLSRRSRGAALAVVVALLVSFTAITVRMNAVWRNSVTLWEYVIARDPSNADAANNLGIALMRGGSYGEAERIMKRAVGLRPGFASAHNNLANVYLRTGRYDDAHAELRRAAALTKDIVYAANVHITTGLVYEAQGEYGKALEAYTTARKLQPVYLDDSRLKELIAHCRRMAGDRR